jgi:hypothetical protein
MKKKLMFAGVLLFAFMVSYYFALKHTRHFGAILDERGDYVVYNEKNEKVNAKVFEDKLGFRGMKLNMLKLIFLDERKTNVLVFDLDHPEMGESLRPGFSLLFNKLIIDKPALIHASVENLYAYHDYTVSTDSIYFVAYDAYKKYGSKIFL